MVIGPMQVVIKLGHWTLSPSTLRTSSTQSKYIFPLIIVTFSKMPAYVLFMLTFNFYIVDTTLEFAPVVYYEPRPSVLLFVFFRIFGMFFFCGRNYDK